MESNMVKCKLILSTLLGAACGAALMYYVLLAVIINIFVGPIYGEDQMSQNFMIFLVGMPLLTIAGAVTGWLIARKLLAN
ncbi:hypothetical protein N5923_05955 [Erwiniaceae bacterium BAC15a-03b]|uniref:Uncharacterized protein n=1 Tax=Winslowiella arboricola TaxID=2978220 RepID=A0A9J6PFF0_9GAMM|nr:hypothetical protein [Winslowiella arboricola]MCU5771336.1 hypothetical protein [Winslowiella arboricola]MCU5777033.1 hypothetical protein [Winslowiella arboricola]